MKYAISIDKTMPARHAVKLPNGRFEAIHGHSWRVLVTVQRDELDCLGMVMDFSALDHAISRILSPMADHVLNEVDPFRGDHADYPAPTAECVARWIGTSLQSQLPSGVHLAEVRVEEEPGCTAVYRLDAGH